jgi:5-methylcytosine-specific restriction endonuclease McrA
MPTAPFNGKCSHLGCNNPRTRFSSLCLDHGGRDKQRTYSSKERKESNSFYATSQWKRQRIVELSRQPLCQACLIKGMITPATEVDHVFPWRQIGEEAFYLNVFQCLCHDHHSLKTQLEKHGIIKHYCGEETDLTLSDYARLVR